MKEELKRKWQHERLVGIADTLVHEKGAIENHFYGETIGINHLYRFINEKLLPPPFGCLEVDIERVEDGEHPEYFAPTMEWFTEFYRKLAKMLIRKGEFVNQDYEGDIASWDERKLFYECFLWRMRARAIRYMDNMVCQNCFEKGKRLDVHHSFPIQRATSKNLYKNFDPEFLVTLCTDCHKEFHERYGCPHHG